MRETTRKDAKCKYTWLEVLDERGRYITEKEFAWLMDYFKDRYDPRRLVLALNHTTGLRSNKTSNLKFKDFNDDCTWIKTTQDKPSAKADKKTGIIRLRTAPKNVPLTDWLALDIQHYIKYRLAVCQMGGYQEYDIRNMHVFPGMQTNVLHRWFYKLRLRHGDKQPWLKDIYARIWRFDKDRQPLGDPQHLHRIAPHCGRAFYATAAYDVCNQDLVGTKLCTGHSQTRHVERYTKVQGIMEKKIEIKERHMDKLCSKQELPILVGQKRLEKWQ